MTTREKIIVSIMCLTIIYGAYELFGTRRSGTRAPAVEVDAVSDLPSFVAEITQKMAGEKAAKEYQYMITLAGTPWTKDPFLHSTEALKPNLAPVAAVAPVEEKEPPPQFVYTGYLATGSSKLAIVNGLEYTEGEALPTDGYYIKTIFPNRVVIARVNSPEIIQLPIEAMD
jgi:hypothetical protein